MTRYACIAALLLAMLAPCARAADPASPEAIVQLQLDAYNAHDIEAFLATYSDDAALYDFPASPRLKGKDAMRARYTARFADKLLHATIPQRIVMGNTVIDREHVRLTLPDGPGALDAVAIYEVSAGKIVKVTFIMGATTPDRAPAKP
jgi:hypothetical protein